MTLLAGVLCTDVGGGFMRLVAAAVTLGCITRATLDAPPVGVVAGVAVVATTAFFSS